MKQDFTFTIVLQNERPALAEDQLTISLANEYST